MFGKDFFVAQGLQRFIRLIRCEATKIDHLLTRDARIRVDVVEDHLLLLHLVETGLPDVLGLLSKRPVQIRRQCVTAAAATAVGLEEIRLAQSDSQCFPHEFVFATPDGCDEIAKAG